MFPFSQKRLLSILLCCCIFSSVYFLLPAKQSHAQIPVTDVAAIAALVVIQAQTLPPAAATPVVAANSVVEKIHQFILKPLAWALAKNILQGITAQTVNWINTGFNGNPAYVTNPDQFFLNVGDQSVSAALGANGGLLAKICTPFQPQIRLALVQQYLQQNQLQQCSLTQIVKNYDGFINNFENGGWDAWFSITQNQQNNPYGAYIAAQDQLNISIANNTTKYQKQLDWGQGFLSKEVCTQHAASTAISSDNTNATQGTTKQVCVQNAPLVIGDPNSGKCLQYKTVVEDANGNEIAPNAQVGDCIATQTVTPGSVINDTLKKSLGSSIDQLNLVNDINQIVSALMTQAIKGVVGGISGGLHALSQPSQTDSNNRPLVQQLLDQSQSSAASTQTINTITSSYPGSLTGVFDASGPNSNSFTPTIDENAIEADLAAKAAALQNKAVSSIENAIASPVASVTSVQGYDATTGTYYNAGLANAGEYLVLYGSFAPSGNTVTVSDPNNTSATQTYTPSYESTSQINVLLGSDTGNRTVTVASSKGPSNEYNITIRPAGTTSGAFGSSSTGGSSSAPGTGQPTPIPTTGNVCADAFNQCSNTPGRTDCNTLLTACLQATQTPPSNTKP